MGTSVRFPVTARRLYAQINIPSSTTAKEKTAMSVGVWELDVEVLLHNTKKVFLETIENIYIKAFARDAISIEAGSNGTRSKDARLHHEGHSTCTFPSHFCFCASLDEHEDPHPHPHIYTWVPT